MNKADEVSRLYDLISEYNLDNDKSWKIFEKAIIIGAYSTEKRFEAIKEGVGKELASEVIFEAVVKEALLSPFFTDQVPIFDYLRDYFDEKITAKIILKNTGFLSLFQEGYYEEWSADYSKRRRERENALSAIVKEYLPK